MKIKIDPIAELLIANALVYGAPRGIKTYPDLRVWAEAQSKATRRILGEEAKS